MIAALLAATLAARLAELPPQRLEPGRCQLFLWVRADPPRRVAMALDRPDQLRLMLDGSARDLALTQRSTPGPAGFAPRATYADASLSVTLDLTLAQRPGLQGGAVVESGALRLEAPGQPAEVLPVGGLAACNPDAATR